MIASSSFSTLPDSIPSSPRFLPPSQHQLQIRFRARPKSLDRMEMMKRLGIGCFAANRIKREVTTEKDSGGGGGEDLFVESGEKPDHLVVMVNGIIGR